MINKCTLLLTTVTFLLACNKIKTGHELLEKETSYIRSLGLLQEHEQIIKFYSNYKFRNAGNFFTDQRIAKYWIDQKDSARNEIASAYYDDILSIDSNSNVSSSKCPYLLITRKDHSRFKVFVNGRKTAVKEFFAEAIGKWTNHQTLASLAHQPREAFQPVRISSHECLFAGNVKPFTHHFVGLNAVFQHCIIGYGRPTIFSANITLLFWWTNYSTLYLHPQTRVLSQQLIQKRPREGP